MDAVHAAVAQGKEHVIHTAIFPCNVVKIVATAVETNENKHNAHTTLDRRWIEEMPHIILKKTISTPTFQSTKVSKYASIEWRQFVLCSVFVRSTASSTEIRRAMYVEYNTEGRSRNHCCHGKAFKY